MRNMECSNTPEINGMSAKYVYFNPQILDIFYSDYNYYFVLGVSE